MAPEVRWQASSAASSGRDVAASDRESVESLLRRLIKRIEESERRYAEALDELHARLGHISYAAGVTEVIGSPEETENFLSGCGASWAILPAAWSSPNPQKSTGRFPRSTKPSRKSAPPASPTRSQTGSPRYRTLRRRRHEPNRNPP